MKKILAILPPLILFSTFAFATPPAIPPGAPALPLSGGHVVGPIISGSGAGDVDDNLQEFTRTATNPLSNGGSHASRDITNYTPAGSSGGYASYDSIPVYGGSIASNHFHAFQARPQLNLSAALSDASGFTWQPTVTGTVAVGVSYGVHMFDALGTGPITSQVGIWCEILTRGSSNYCLYNAGSATNYLGAGLTQIGTGGQLRFPSSFSSYGALLGHDGTGNVIDNPRLAYINGALSLNGTVSPSVSLCGTSPAISGHDNSFTLTMGSATTTCSVTFGTVWVVAPKVCVAMPTNSAAAATGTTGLYVASITTSVITFTGLNLAGASYGVHCM